MIQYEIIKPKANFIEPKVEIKNLPELTGTEKQIALAEKIRQEKLSSLIRLYEQRVKVDIRAYYKEEIEKISLMDKEFNFYLEKEAMENSSKIWIDNRDKLIGYNNIMDMFRHIFKD